MCEFMSLIVEKNGTIHAFPGVDSHHEILNLAQISDNGSDFRPAPFAKIELNPPTPYTKDVTKWHYVIDEVTEPDWLTGEHERACRSKATQILKREQKGEEVAFPNGSRRTVYRKNGKRHRIGGPAYAAIESDGSWTEVWFKNGKRHRIGGPAYAAIESDGSWIEEWHKNGKYHRADGPAFTEVESDGSWSEEWYENGKCHRADGPAITRIDVYGSWEEEWYENGVRIETVRQ